MFSLPLKVGFNSRGCLSLKMSWLKQFKIKRGLGHFHWCAQLTAVPDTLDAEGCSFPSAWMVVFFQAWFQTTNVSFHMLKLPSEVNRFRASAGKSEDRLPAHIYLQCLFSCRSSRPPSPLRG